MFLPPCFNKIIKQGHQALRGVLQVNIFFQLAQKVVKNHPSECRAGKEGCVVGGRISLLLSKDKEVEVLDLLLQQHQKVAPLSRVPHLVQVVVRSRTYCMLSRLAKTRKILLIWSPVHYESFIKIFMHCYIQGLHSLMLFCI